MSNARAKHLSENTHFRRKVGALKTLSEYPVGCVLFTQYFRRTMCQCPVLQIMGETDGITGVTVKCNKSALEPLNKDGQQTHTHTHTGTHPFFKIFSFFRPGIFCRLFYVFSRSPAFSRLARNELWQRKQREICGKWLKRRRAAGQEKTEGGRRCEVDRNRIINKCRQLAL